LHVIVNNKIIDVLCDQA